MKKNAFFTVIALLCCLLSYSQLLTEYNFNNQPYIEASFSDSLIIAGTFSLSAGTIGTNITTGTYFTNEPYIEESGGWGSGDLINSKYFSFTVNALTGYNIALNKLSFQMYATASGPEFVTVAINNDSAYSIIIKDSVINVEIPLQGYNNFAQAEIKIYGRLNGSRASSGNGIFRIDEVKLYGGASNIDINATKITDSGISDIVFTDSLFSINLCATDSLGTIDTDYNSNISITADFDKGTFSQPTSKFNKFNSGVYSQYGFSYSVADTFSITANSSTLKPFSKTIIGAYPVYIPKLKAAGLTNWINTNNWDTITINSKIAIKHNISDITGISYISQHYDTANTFGKGKTAWHFIIETADFDPSASNCFWYYLMASDKNLTSDNIYGYAAGVNMSGISDTLSLWRIDANSNKILLLQSKLDWNENTACAIEITRSNNGLWQIGWNEGYIFSSLEYSNTKIDATYYSLNYHGLVFKHQTASRAGKLTFIPELFFQVDQAPVLLHSKALSQNAIELKFSENISSHELNAANITITNEYGNSIAIENITAGLTSESFIIATSPLNTGTYNISINKLHDNEGNAANNLRTSFTFNLSATYGDIVINEIMAKPSADYGLPDAEYVELYNRTDFDICTKGWIFNYGTSFKPIDSTVIKAHEYIIICDRNDTSALSPYGKCIGIPLMPALSESGSITIYNADTLPIYYTKYKNSWISEELKADGGYSLERIDYKNTCNNKNWKGCNDIKGGTPGQINSIYTDNQDADRPNIVKIVPISDNSVKVYFDKTMNFKAPPHFKINDRDIPISVNWQQPDYSYAILVFSFAFEQNKEYTLTANANTTDISGNVIDKNEASFMIPKLFSVNDILINELLFDPLPNCTDFVELYNPTNKAFNLNKLYLSSYDDLGLLKTKYEISADGYLLMPQSYVVVCSDINMVTGCYNVDNKFAVIEAKIPSLPNTGGSIVLLDSVNNIIDEFTYCEKMHFKLLSETKGVSLERISPLLPTNDKGNWHSASSYSGWATPTYINSMYKEYDLQSNDEIHLEPKNFSPDNDGYDDILKIFYTFNNPGLVGNVSIFNKNGYKIKSIAENELLAQNGIWTWDGLTDNNTKVPIGIYVIYIEVFDTKGTIKSFKKVCSVNARF